MEFYIKILTTLFENKFNLLLTKYYFLLALFSASVNMKVMLAGTNVFLFCSVQLVYKELFNHQVIILGRNLQGFIK